MNLEDEILGVEEEAAKIVAAAQAEAKEILGGAEEGRKRIREEAARRVREEKERLARAHEASLAESVAQVARERDRNVAAVEAVRAARAGGCVRGIVEMLLKV